MVNNKKIDIKYFYFKIIILSNYRIKTKKHYILKFIYLFYKKK